MKMEFPKQLVKEIKHVFCKE